MNNSEDILAKIKSVINQIIDIDDSKFSPNANLRDDLGADSLASVEIVMALEENFGVEFTEEQAKNVQTVGDVVAFITNNTVSSSPEMVA